MLEPTEQRPRADAAKSENQSLPHPSGFATINTRYRRHTICSFATSHPLFVGFLPFESWRHRTSNHSNLKRSSSFRIQTWARCTRSGQPDPRDYIHTPPARARSPVWSSASRWWSQTLKVHEHQHVPSRRASLPSPGTQYLVRRRLPTFVAPSGCRNPSFPAKGIRS